MKPIVFVDTVCPAPYSPKELAMQGLGGTEATVVRLAEMLGMDNINVHVAQHNRVADLEQYSASYVRPLPYLLTGKFKAQAFIALRDPNTALNLKKANPDVPVLLWCHDLSNPTFSSFGPLLKAAGITLVAVSEFHKTNLVEGFRANAKDMTTDVPLVKVVYNPVNDWLVPSERVQVDPNQLLFASSPHKGLERALSLFEIVKKHFPEMKLKIANPGYYETNIPKQAGVIDIGSISHNRLATEMMKSLAVFYPNNSFPETFGLVMAEANAVGTPVITHPIGAAREVLGEDHNTSQLIDTQASIEEIVNRIKKFREERPKVSLNPKFRIKEVVKAWKELLK